MQQRNWNLNWRRQPSPNPLAGSLAHAANANTHVGEIPAAEASPLTFAVGTFSSLTFDLLLKDTLLNFSFSPAAATLCIVTL